MELIRYVCLIVLSLGLEFANGKTISSETPVERPLFIGSFNIQNLGKSKMDNSKVIDVVKKVLLRYDLVLVQEIVTKDETLMTKLLQELNELAPKGTKYLAAISERLGRGNAKEQYAFIYRSERLRFLEGHAFPDHGNEFMRPPYIAHFATPTLRDVKSLLAIGIHTQPKHAANETSSLAGVYDYASGHYGIKNAILMGDMNAGCSNVRIGDWEHIELWTREEFTWLINHDRDTTLSANCCPYDRFVIAGNDTVAAVIWDSIGTYNFREANGLDTSEALEVSDHWPIEVKLRGKVSKEVKEHIQTSVCLTVDDARKGSLPSEFQRQKTTLGFTIENYEFLTELSNHASDSNQLLSNLEKLGVKYPQLLSREVISTLFYKVNHGTLEDKSSHDDIQNEFYTVTVDFDKTTSATSVHFCTKTTAN